MTKHRILISIVMVLFLPMLLLSNLEPPAHEEAATTQTEPRITVEETKITVWNGESAEEMDLETYIASVLLAEMPAEFDMEALKAQSVAIRTYTLRRASTGGKHEQAHVCTEPACCQAFSVLDGAEPSARVLEAVSGTKSQVLTYNDELIEATYFSCSGGRTEAAVEVWGSDVPYLQAKDSPGEEIATHYQDTVILSAESFTEKLGLQQLSDVTDITYTSGGGVKAMTIGETEFSGTQLRQLLDLRSTAFEITFLDESVVITTKGYGHRVGMSQYGAEAMAVAGSMYDEILSYYYPGTELKELSAEDTARIFDKAGNL